MSSWRRAVLLGASGCLLTCAARPATSQPGVERFAVTELRACGVSGVSLDDAGTVWAVSESRRELYAFEPGRWALPKRYVLGELSRELEVESAAWASDGRLLLGTEVDVPRSADKIIVVRMEGEEARVRDVWQVDWARLFGAQAPSNQGIEGLCASRDWVLASGEAVVQGRDGKRLAPVVRATLGDAAAGRWQAGYVELTSDVGKISALECHAAPDGSVSVHAIERHYGVTHVIGFHWAAPSGAPAGGPPRLAARVLLDIKRELPSVANVEGLTYLDDRMILLTDHDPDDGPGDTEIYVLASALPGELAAQ